MTIDIIPGEPVPPLAGFDRTHLEVERRRSCESFLATRGTSLERLARIVGEQIEDVRHVLLTSSPVHGLANATSDIDTISVVEDRTIGERTATQIFDGPNHCETIPFTAGEVASELRRLDEAACLPTAAAVGYHRAWDKGGPIGRKYLERLVNGVAVDGTSPFLAALPSLAVLWRAASFGRAAAMADCGRMSVAAGEHRGAIGYTVNALLYGMDALLSHHGRVYSNKKWYLLRFRQFVSEGAGGSGGRDAARALDELWHDAETVLGGEADPAAAAAAILQHLDAVMDVVGDHLGLSLARVGGWGPAPDVRTLDFLPGARARIAGGRFIITEAANPDSEVIFTPFQRSGEPLDAGAARLRLRAARAGFLVPSFDA